MDRTSVNPGVLAEEQARILYMQAPVANATVFTISLLFFFMLRSRVESDLVIYWALALWLSAILRLTLWYLRRTGANRWPVESWLRYYFIGCGLMGVSWSLIYPLIVMVDDPFISLALTMLLFGVMGSSVVTQHIYFPAFVIYTYPQVLTLVITMLFLPDQAQILVALALMVYLAMTTLFTRNLNHSSLNSIVLQLQNTALVEELSQEVSQRETLIEQRTGELQVKNAELTREIGERKRAESALRQSEQRLAAFFASSPAGMGLLDRDFRYLLVNENLARMHGLVPQDNIGKSLAEVLPQSAQVIEPMFRQILETNEPVINHDLSGEMPSRPGEVSHYTVSYFPIPDVSGQPGAIGIVVIDITDRKQVEEALHKSEERFGLAMQGTNDGVYDWNLVTNEIYYSPRWKNMLGYADDELNNDFSVWEDLIDATDHERSWDMLTDYINGRRDNYRLEVKMRHKDGHWLDILARAFLVRDEAGRAVRVVGTHVDITEKKKQEQQILRQAHYDGLTNLPNRFLALDRLTQLIKEAGRTGTYAAVLFLDLDGFKRVNDSLGHETGDQLLKQSAERLTETLRDGDTVCRLGGDEFIVLLSGLKHAADAHSVAENMVLGFRAPFILDERELVVTASIGIAIYPDDGSSSAELLRNADTAMYHSKEQGRNTYHYFTDAMNRDVSRRLAVEEQLHGALGRQEFNVLFQPIVNLQTCAVAGAEALLRWQNPVLGDVSPEEFIPIAEQTGSIVEIGHYVLLVALDSAKRWRQKGDEDFKITVNLSPRQFRAPDLTDSIRAALEKFDFSPESLVLEITEGVLMSGHAYLENALKMLDVLGVGIAMDDFGTGYSSLSYLRTYPFNVLKIDRSFINDITVDQADRELVNAAILMAHGLGLKVVAEGVETAEQLEYLRHKGCEFAQGYLFSRPVSAEKFTELLRLEI